MITSFTYQPTFNRVASVTDPLGHATTFAYDSNGNLTSVTNALGQQTTLTYNTAGQPLTVANPLGNITRFEYDQGDLAAVIDPLNNRTSRFVDSAGRLGGVTSPLGLLTRYAHDSLNRLTQLTDPQGGVTQFGYDPNSNLLSVTDARNNMTSHTYSSMDRLASRTDPLLRAESYTYDLGGNLTTFTDRKNQVTSSTYDALNRRTQVTYTESSSTSYTYDAGNRLTQIVDALSGTITRTYDNLDRLTQETNPQGTVSYTYDAAGRRNSMTVAGQPTVTYAYDNANRLTQVTQGTATVTLAYDTAGRRTSLTLPNGVVTEYAYDSASRVTGLTYRQGTTTLGTLTYTYDAAGNRTQVGGTWARIGLPPALASATYDAANQQLAFGASTLTYDLNGDLVSDGTNSYSWNSRHQLTSMAGPGVTATFHYDAQGRRLRKTVNGTTTEFVYDGPNPVQEQSGASVLATTLTGLGLDEVFTRTDAAGARAVLANVVGSTIALADPAGTVQTEYSYEPFGRTTATGATDANPFQFTGREHDGTGLYYYRARYYHPSLSRFVSEDPLMLRGGDLNFYSYVQNNPTRFADPLGLSRKDAGGQPPCAPGSPPMGPAGGAPPPFVAQAGGAPPPFPGQPTGGGGDDSPSPCRQGCWQNLWAELLYVCGGVGGGGGVASCALACVPIGLFLPTFFYLPCVTACVYRVVPTAVGACAVYVGWRYYQCRQGCP